MDVRALVGVCQSSNRRKWPKEGGERNRATKSGLESPTHPAQFSTFGRDPVVAGRQTELLAVASQPQKQRQVRARRRRRPSQRHALPRPCCLRRACVMFVVVFAFSRR
jgi:hypothetical protein